MTLILVVGPPRSGTSVVARILHERIGICMGHNLVPGNAGNPKGFYEDFRMVGATKKARNHTNWLKALENVHEGCNKPRGVKSPELAFINMATLRPDLIIRTCRPLLDVSSSLERWQQPKPSSSKAVRMVVRYERCIEKQIPWITCPMHRVEFHGYRDEGELERELREVCSSVV